MAKRSHLLRGGIRFTGADYEPYTKAIGGFVLTWNDLHEKLALVFAAVLSHADRRNIAEDDRDDLFKEIERFGRIWDSSTLDRPKRAMLRGILTPLVLADLIEFPKLPEEIQEDLTWILNEADKLEDLRNMVVHLPLLDPLYFEDDSPRPSHRAWSTWYKERVRTLKLDRVPSYPLVPNHLMGNRRAKAANPSGGWGFSSAELLRQFRRGRRACEILRDYALRIGWALRYPDEAPWPDKPSLPNRGQKKSRRTQRHPAHAK